MAGIGEVIQSNNELREELRVLREALSKAQAMLAERDAQLEAVKRTAEQLAQELELIRLARKGPASQRFVPDSQALLPFTTGVEPPPRAPVDTPQCDVESTEEAAKVKRPGSNKPKRRNRQDFDHLDSQSVHVPAADQTCQSCGEPLEYIGVAKSFRVEWVPGRFVVHDIARDKCACRKCPSEGVFTAAGPYALDRSLAGNGLVARVLVDKFADHIPANRQAKRMGREGFKVGSHTLSAWIGAAGQLLRYLGRVIQQEVLEASAIQGDDTGLPVQDGGDGQLRKGRMWAFTDQEQVFYAFTDTKEGKHPTALLDGYAGSLLLVDGGSEFNEAVRTLGLDRAGCWSHLRTYFHKARAHHPGDASLALGTIKDLFMIEREVWCREPAEVLAARRAKSKPLVDGFFAWVKGMSQITRPESVLGKALGYAINQEQYLRLFLEYGELPMHNNLSELMLRQTVVGRKNWLFARSEGGAHAAATMYTLIGSCYLQGIDPWFYLRDVLDRIQDYPANRLVELTPRNWAATRQGHTSKQS